MSEQTETEHFRQIVSESDIDWLVCVELNANSAFRGWMVSKILPGASLIQHDRAWRSVSNALGETDLLWRFTTADGNRHLVLIENKIGAVAQPEQYLRYLLRGEDYRLESLCSSFSVALLAPERYRSEDSVSYSIRISYEEVREWLRACGDERSSYLALLFDAAINKLGSLAPVDGEVSRFQELVWQLARREFPELHVPDPRGVSATQHWVYMRYPAFTLIYKMYKTSGKFGDCVVDLELAGRASEVDALRVKYMQHLTGSNVSVQQTGKSAAFRIQVPPIEPPNFDEQKVREGLQAALLLWWQRANTD